MYGDVEFNVLDGAEIFVGIQMSRAHDMHFIRCTAGDILKMKIDLNRRCLAFAKNDTNFNECGSEIQSSDPSKPIFIAIDCIASGGLRVDGDVNVCTESCLLHVLCGMSIPRCFLLMN